MTTTTAETFRPRLLKEVARDIIDCWEVKRPSPSTMNHAGPYLEAMAAMDFVEDMYYLERGDMIVAYFLNNVTGWRGVDARRIKAELKKLLEDYNKGIRYKTGWPTNNGIPQ